jgi:hypothetical protein
MNKPQIPRLAGEPYPCIIESRDHRLGHCHLRTIPPLPMSHMRTIPLALSNAIVPLSPFFWVAQRRLFPLGFGDNRPWKVESVHLWQCLASTTVALLAGVSLD